MAYIDITWAEEGALNAGLLYAMVTFFAVIILAFKTPSLTRMLNI